MLETIDLGLRAACLGVCLLLAIHFASIRPVSRKTVSALAKIASAAGLVIISGVVFGMHEQPWATVRTLVVSLSPVFIAWGMLELFEDDFQIETWQLVFVSLAVPTHFMTAIHPSFGLICHGSTVAIYAYLFYVAFATKNHDLVEARRQFRLWFMSGAAFAGITFTSLHWYYGELNVPDWVHILKAATMLVLSVVFSFYTLKVREHVWAMPQTRKLARAENLTPAEMSLLAKLKASMEENIWRQEGLTIRKLSEVLEAPEHRLRRVINHGLGYRNFAAFVNEHRIGAACEVLADPVKADIPVITIAYEVGYASLGPFNRAFKEIVGESPTEYRRRSVVHP